ncbi:MAG TPA: bifunctional riboflavin kinase/FAD synthetase [Ktedonobacterales bacterium]|jgi:riboflavin kinase/FMN adenylyltransferase
MQVIRELETLTPGQPYALTVGVFDGIHQGHRFLIQETCRAAKDVGAQAGMVTFWPHPLEVLRPGREVRYLTLLEEKLDILAKQGDLDMVVVLPFTPALAATSASGFMELLRRHLVLRVLVEGTDFAFGHNREGTMAFLSAYGKEHGFLVETIDLQLADNERISSTRVRDLLGSGQVEDVMPLLGRPYSARGRVVQGDQRGRLLGFPTANLSLDARKFLPADGVYAVRAQVGEQGYEGVTNIGVRPTVDGKHHLTEVHLLDMQADLYGQELEIEFIARLRGEQRFPNVEALRGQIEQDIRQARVTLGQYGKGEPERGAVW